MFSKYILILTFSAGIFFWTSFDALLPTLPIYIQNLGATELQIGIVMGSLSIGLLFLRPQIGYLSDRYGRKIGLLTGTLIATVAPLTYILTDNIFLLTIIRAVHGISIAAWDSSYMALAADLVSQEKRVEVFGYVSLIRPLGISIGPAIGSLLQLSFGYTVMSIVISGIGLLSMLCVALVNEPDKPILSEVENSQVTSSNFWSLLLSARLRAPIIVFLFGGMIFAALSIFIALFINQRHINLDAGLFFAVAGIANIFARLITGKIKNRFGEGTFISLGLVLYSISVLLLVFTNNSTVVLFAGLLEGVGAALWIPTLLAVIANRSFSYERGRVYSICLGSMDLGTALAGLGLGYLANIFSYGMIFALSASLGLLSVVVFMTQSSNNLISSLKFAVGIETDSFVIESFD